MDYKYNPNEFLFGPEAIAYKKVQLIVDAMLKSKKEEIINDIKKNDVDLLCHILISRGKGRKPVIPEAVYLNNINRMIQETDAMQESLQNAQPNTIISDNHIFNNKIYKRSTEEIN